jgi:hypothetical protein
MLQSESDGKWAQVLFFLCLCVCRILCVCVCLGEYRKEVLDAAV